jgi:hypothetical protein
MHIGFTGTRDGMTDKQVSIFNIVIRCFNDSYEKIGLTAYFHHGDCIGADALAHHIADGHSIPIVIHPPANSAARANCKPKWSTATWRDSKPYLDRNRDIVNDCDVLIACPKGYAEERRSGTWATIRYARKCGKPVVILEP